MRIFKIRNKKTGLFVSPNQYSDTKVGKTWASASALGCHLAAHEGQHDKYRSGDYEVLEFSTEPVRVVSVADYRKEVARRSHTQSRG